MRELALDEINMVAGGDFAGDMVTTGQDLQSIGGATMAIGAVTMALGGSGVGTAGFGGALYLSGALLEWAFTKDD